MTLGQARDFYKLHELNTAEWTFVNGLLGKMNSLYRPLHKEWIAALNIVSSLRKMIETERELTPEDEATLENARIDAGEKLQTLIEKTGSAHIDALLRADSSFFSTKKFEFGFFLGVQYFRTAKRKTGFATVMSRMEAHYPDFPQELAGMDGNKIWNVLIPIFATNVAVDMAINNPDIHLIFLHNASRVAFITCDQPVINTFDSISESEGPKKMEFYYPISPNMAVLITREYGSHPPTSMDLAENEVLGYNQLMIEKSHSQVYSHSMETLKMLFPEATI
jgi:hypothetical protein